MNDEQLIKKTERYVRQRKLRTVIFAVLSAAFLGMSFWSVRGSQFCDAHATPEKISAMASFEDPKAELPALLSYVYTMSTSSARLRCIGRYCALASGLLIGALIVNVAGSGKHQLILSIWGKIQALEKEVEELKAGPRKESQAMDPPPVD